MSWGVRRIEDESTDPAYGAGRRSAMTVGEWLDSVAIPQRGRAGTQPAASWQDTGRQAPATSGSLDALDRKLEELNRRLKRLSDTAKPSTRDRRAEREMSRRYRPERSGEDRDTQGYREKPTRHDPDPIAAKLDQIDRRLAAIATPRAEETQASMRGGEHRTDRQHVSDSERLRHGLREIERLQATLMEGLNERHGKSGQAIERYLQEERERTSRVMSPVAETVARLESEVRGLRQTVESRMEPSQSAFEDSDLQDIRRMLHRVSELGPGRQDSVQVDRLFEEINRLRDLVVDTSAKTLTLATAKSTQESRLADMVERLAAVATSAQEKTSDDMRLLERRLADIADRMTDVEGRGANARDLAELQNAINGIAAKLDRPMPVAKPVIPAGLIDLDIRIEKLSDKLDRFEPVTGNPRQMASLETEIAALRLDLAQQSANRQDGGAFKQQISALGERIDRLASAVQASASKTSNLDTFETRIGDLVDMIDRVVGSETTLDKSVGTLQSEVTALRRDLSQLGTPQRNPQLEAHLRELAERLDKVAGHSGDPQILAKIEEKIGRLTDLVHAASRPAAETGGIEQKLAKLELLLADHRDDTLEAASSAAREAVREFASFAADTRQSDETVRALEDDLRRVQDATRTNEARTSDALQSVHDALTTIVSRLGAIERVATERPTDRIIERVPEPKMPDRRPAEPRMAEARPIDLDMPRVSGEALAPNRVGTPQGLTDDLATQPRSGPDMPTAAARAPDVAQPRPEDHRPLEPGSGKPRVAASPVAGQPQAGQSGSSQSSQPSAPPRAAQAQGSPAHRPEPAAHYGLGGAANGGFAQGPAGSDGEAGAPKRNDFIAAARRAALSASQPAIGAPPLPGQRGPADLLEAEAPKGGKSLFGSLFKSKQKALVLAGVGVAAAATGVAFVASSVMHAASVDSMPTASLSSPSTAAPRTLVTARPDTSAAAIALQPPSQVTSSFSQARPNDEAARQSALANAMKQSALAQGIKPQPMPEQAQAPAHAPIPNETTASINPPAAEPTGQMSSPIGTTVSDAGAPDQATALSKPMSSSGTGPFPLPSDKIGSMALRTAAANGDPKAQFEVGMRFSEGRGVPSDMHEAAIWFERAAMHNFEPAAYRLGSAYEKGLGVDRNALEAKRWYRIAAEGGNIRAMHNLGVLYANDHDMPSALQWFQKAADAGLKDSQFNLGIIYALGSGVKQDLAVSYKWFALGAAQGDQEAARKRDDIATHLDHTALAAAKLAVSTWRAMPISREANEETAVWSEPAATASAHTAPPPQPPEGWNKIMQAQAALQGKGLYVGKIDGELTPETKAAIRAYQKKSGLKPTGDIDNAFMSALLTKQM